MLRNDVKCGSKTISQFLFQINKGKIKDPNQNG